jgi:predicted RNase H-like HicB family nuclease
MKFEIEFDREDDGRWIAEIRDIPGALVYGASQEEARSEAENLAADVLADEN